jgi:isopentenyl-diphosphate delta-isomerase
MEDELILVNAQDEIIGFREKEKCHLNNGTLHRAFSIFIFNSKGELLLQQRGKYKMLWSLFWSNTCCSHPRRGETIENAAARRIVEECGIACELKRIYKFKYSSKFNDIGSENEICHVFIGRNDDDPVVAPEEIENWKWIKINELLADVSNNPKRYTPWFKLELEELGKRELI